MQGWGRWGADDERGALNLLGAAEVRRGIGEVIDGTVIALSAPIRSGRGFSVVGRNPPAHCMVRDGGDYAAGLPERAGFGFADDVVTLPTHGVTYVDAAPGGSRAVEDPIHVDELQRLVGEREARLLMRGYSIYFSELMDLSGMAEAGRATFLFILAPLPLVGGVGSPVAPVAVL